MKPNVKNEVAKRKFYRWLKEADGRCDATVNNIEKSIELYESQTRAADFSTFSADRAIDFKEWLSKRKFRDKPLCITTYYSYIKNLRKFFLWLSWQPGYRSKITPDKVNYFTVTDKEKRIATQSAVKNYPSLEYVLKLTGSIHIKTEIDIRDRALIAFALLSGMRDAAIATLPLGCFDEGRLIVTQDPRKGVKTKFSKNITSMIFIFDSQLFGYLIEWMEHLKDKGFGANDPLFSKAKQCKGPDNLTFEEATEVDPAFWNSANQIRIIFKRRSSDTNMRYYAPHTFRHLCVRLALKHCRTMEQLKAVSQNFGHEYVGTILASYGNYDTQNLIEILKGVDFSGKFGLTTDEKIDMIIKKMNIEC